MIKKEMSKTVFFFGAYNRSDSRDLIITKFSFLQAVLRFKDYQARCLNSNKGPKINPF